MLVDETRSFLHYFADDSPKPAPRQVSKQAAVKPAVSSLSLKLPAPKKLPVRIYEIFNYSKLY